MIYALLGETCSGKTTLRNRLMELGFSTIVGYTTRPQRPNEVNGKDYNFISKETYDALGKSIVAKNSFKNAFAAVWHYGFLFNDIEPLKNQIIILDPKGYRDLINDIGKENVVGIYLNVPLEVRLMRGLNRKDNVNELTRRLESDKKDFENLGSEVDYIVNSTTKAQQVGEVLSIIGGLL